MANMIITVYEIESDNYKEFLTDSKATVRKVVRKELQYTGNSIKVRSYQMQKSAFDNLPDWKKRV